MSQPADFAAPVTLHPIKSRSGDKRPHDSEENSVKAYEASPAEIEDAVFGSANADGPNYRNVSITIAVPGHSTAMLNVSQSLLGRMDGSCCLDDEGPGRFGSIVLARDFPHLGSRPRSHRLDRHRYPLDL
jgi:hypothetical protein